MNFVSVVLGFKSSVPRAMDIIIRKAFINHSARFEIIFFGDSGHMITDIVDGLFAERKDTSSPYKVKRISNGNQDISVEASAVLIFDDMK